MTPRLGGPWQAHVVSLSWAGLALLVACQKPVEPPPPALDVRARTLPTTPPPAVEGPPLLGVGQADAVVADMLERVQGSRELQARTPVSSRVISRAEMIKQVKGHVEKDVPSVALRGQGEMLTAMGYMPPTFDFAKGLFDLLESQVAGYYDPADKRMYLVSDLGETETQATLAHELVHALQDQHYDLDKRMKFRDDQSDKLAAIQSLAEGDAMAGMMDIEAGGPGMSLLVPDEALAMQMRAGIMLMPSIANIPPIMKASLVAPYTDGLVFVQKLRRRGGGFAEVDRVWQRPPETTEQMLHLDKLDKREPALTVPGPPLDALGGGFEKLFGDSNGEQGTSLAFQEWGSHVQASRAAAGWGGDHFDVLVRGEGKREHFVTWWIRFDPGGKGGACAEADEAYDFVATRAFKHTGAKHPDSLCRDRPDLGPLAVTKRGCDVVFSAGPYVRGEARRVTAAKPTCAEVTPWLSGWVKSRKD